MPVYEYACKDCGEHLEVAQSFKDEALTVCPHCGGPLRKVFGSIGIAFKGSGFYRTDSRSGSASRDAAPKESKDSKESKADTGAKGSSETKSGSKSDSKPDAKSEAKADT